MEIFQRQIAERNYSVLYQTKQRKNHKENYVYCQEILYFEQHK